MAREQKKILRDTGKSHALEDAVSYVTKGWFPVNTALLKEIKKKLKEGAYKDNNLALLDDLKNDLSLFTYCLRRMNEVVGQEERNNSPAELLTSIEIEKLQAMLDVSEDEISIHEFNPTMKPQAICLKHALISSCTAETLAEKADVDPRHSFLCASVRQLGLNLVAWNYPRIYANALTAIGHNEEDIDVALEKVLGFSPLQLGAKVALGWNTCKETQVAVGLGEVDPDETADAKASESEAGEKIRHLCEIGETIAKVNDPEHFPKAVKQWERVFSEVKQYLGPRGMSIIAERLDKSTAHYRDISPALFKIDVTPDKNVQLAQAQYTAKLFENNQNLRKLACELRDKFKAAYEEMVKGDLSPQALRILVSDIIPALGFTRGCIFLMDSERMMLVPMLRVGDAPLSRYRPLSCSDLGESLHPVVQCLNYSAPIIQENVVLYGDQVSHVTGTFGNREKSGVLYLEMSERLVAADRQELIIYFKAVRQCLNDCLNLH